MTDSKSQTHPGSSRLARELSRLTSVSMGARHEGFSEQLSRRVDFAGSVKLSDAQGEVRMIQRRVDAGLLPKGVTESSSSEACRNELEKCQAAFVRVRQAIVQSINQSFEPDSQSRNAFPKLRAQELSTENHIGEGPIEEGSSEEKLSEQHLDAADELSEAALKSLSEAIIKCYRAHQSDMSARVQGLKVHIRELVSAISPELNKLVILDVALEETLTTASRQSLARVSQLVSEIAKRQMAVRVGENQDLFAESRSEATYLTHRRYEQLKKNVLRILHAELELRLQSTLGLIEALYEKINERQEVSQRT